ncbi:MAG: carbohydrate ABC transporter permease [Lachnospiraceae bacterium]|jgi:ABC-type glycerol-3-phosphate transport system permease component|nr:carbohydrate ABC transporter permease [Lachnospiraceae bacterium]
MAYKGHRINPTKFEKSQIKIICAVLPLVIFTALPIVFIVNHAFKPIDELFAFPPNFFVRNPTMDNFDLLMKITQNAGIPMSRYVFNSLIVTVATIFLSLLFTTCAAFALSKIRFRAKNTLMTINQAAIMFVATAVLIPRYLIIAMGGMIDTYWGHILPLVAMPVALFLVKQFTDQVPDSLMEAAYIDGATDFQVYRKIILPMIKPAIATAAILVFQSVWNNLETSNYFMNDDSMKTLTFYMNSFAGENTGAAGQGVAAASALLMFIPNIVLFIILQKNVMNTMAHSGIK